MKKKQTSRSPGRHRDRGLLGASKTYYNKQVGARLEETRDREEDPAAERTEGGVADHSGLLALGRRRHRSFGTTERHGLDGVEDVGHARSCGRVRESLIEHGRVEGQRRRHFVVVGDGVGDDDAP